MGWSVSNWRQILLGKLFFAFASARSTVFFGLRILSPDVLAISAQVTALASFSAIRGMRNSAEKNRWSIAPDVELLHSSVFDRDTASRHAGRSGRAVLRIVGDW